MYLELQNLRNQQAERAQRQPQSQHRQQTPPQAHVQRQSMPQRTYADPMMQQQQMMRPRMHQHIHQPMQQQYVQPQRHQYQQQQPRQPHYTSPRPQLNDGRQITVNSTPPAYFNRQNFRDRQQLQILAQAAQKMLQGQPQQQQYEQRRQPRHFDNRPARHNTREGYAVRQQQNDFHQQKQVVRRPYQQQQRNGRQNRHQAEQRGWQKRGRQKEVEQEEVDEEQEEVEEEQYEDEQEEQEEQEHEEHEEHESEERDQEEEEQEYDEERDQEPQAEPERVIEYKPITAHRLPSKNGQDEPLALEKCSTMCPNKQFNDRLKNFEDSNTMGGTIKLDTQSSFSLFQINKKTNKPDIRLTLKRFKRAANNEEGQNTVVRTPAALVESMEHILRYIIDSDSMPSNSLPFIKPMDKNSISFKEIYDFLWNRTRAMIKQISQLSPDEQRSTKIVTMSEQIARFLILSINEMREFEEFDEQMNKKSIQKILTQLLQSYRYGKEEVKRLLVDLKNKGRSHLQVSQIFEQMEKNRIYISPYEPEISSYALVFTEIKNVYQHLGNISQSLKQLRNSPLMDSKEIRTALEMVDAINTKNIAKFFRLIEDEQTSYLLACTLLFHVHDVRKDTLTRIIKTCRQMNDGEVNKQSLSFKLLNNLLHFNGNEEAMLRFLNHAGATLSHDGIAKLPLSEPDGLHYSSPYYEFAANKLGKQESRQKILRATWRLQPGYSKLVVEALKKFYWEEYEEEPNLAINEEPSAEVRRVEAPTFTNNEEDRIALKEKIKKNKRIKMLQNLKNRTLGLFRRLLLKKKRQSQMLSGLFELLATKMDKHQAVGFKKLRAFSEYIVDLRQNFERLKKTTKQWAFLRNQIQSVDPYAIYSNQHFKDRFLNRLDNLGLNQKVRQAARKRKEDIQNESEIAPSYQELDAFEEKSRAEGFYGVICQSVLESQYAKEVQNPTLRIVIPIDEHSLDHKPYSGNLTMLVAYLTRFQGVEQFYQFLSNDQPAYTFVKYLEFESQMDGSVVNLCIEYVLDFYKYDGQQNMHTVLDQNLYGALAVIYPYLKGASQQNALSNALHSIDQSLQKIPFIVYKVCESKNQPTENTSHFEMAVEYIGDVTVSQRSRAIIDSALRKAMHAKKSSYDIRSIGIYELLGQINVNLSYLNQRVRDNNVKFLFFQEFFNHCIGQIQDAASNLFRHRYLCAEWPILIKECCSKQQLSFKEISQRENAFLDKFLSYLKMDLLKSQYFKITNKIDEISKNMMRYLVVACNSKDVLKNIKESGLIETLQQKCLINASQLPDGAIFDVFSILIGQVTLFYKQFQRCQIILPSQFKFHIKFQELQKRITEKCSSIVRQINPRQTKKCIKDEKLRQRLNENRKRFEPIVLESSFQYVRQKQLDQYLHRINHTRDSTTGQFSFTS